MYLMNLFAMTEIKIDFNEEIIYDKEDVWGDETEFTATVEFELVSTDGLVKLAHAYRDHLGLQSDPESYFNFYVQLNDIGSCILDNDITAIFHSDVCSDDMMTYYINMSEDERWQILRALDRQCREQLGRDCFTLLTESKDALKNWEQNEKGE